MQRRRSRLSRSIFDPDEVELPSLLKTRSSLNDASKLIGINQPGSPSFVDQLDSPRLTDISSLSLRQRLVRIGTNRLFILLTLTLSALYFVITGVQYWISSYLNVVLGIGEDEVYKFYVITCFTAPLLGVVAGGFTFSHMGGYKSQRSFGLCVIMSVLVTLIALPIPMLKTINSAFLCIWLVFFFGSFIVPTLTGILLSMVRQEMRITSQAVATLTFNMLGYLPAPLIYGLVSDMPLGSVERQQRFALASILYVLIVQSALLGLAYAIKYKTLCFHEPSKTFEQDPFREINEDQKYFRFKGNAIDQIARARSLDY